MLLKIILLATFGLSKPVSSSYKQLNIFSALRIELDENN
jgi:hypothetical protein